MSDETSTTTTPTEDLAGAAAPAPAPAPAAAPSVGEVSKDDAKAAKKAARSQARGEKKAARAEAKANEPAKTRSSFSGKDAINRGRNLLGQLVWLVAILAALSLAIGALLVAIKANRHNDLVIFVGHAAKIAQVHVFDRTDGIYQFKHGDNRMIKDALLNWGIGAVAWLIAGRIVSSVIKP